MEVFSLCLNWVSLTKPRPSQRNSWPVGSAFDYRVRLQNLILSLIGLLCIKHGRMKGSENLESSAQSVLGWLAYAGFIALFTELTRLRSNTLSVMHKR